MVEEAKEETALAGEADPGKKASGKDAGKRHRKGFLARIWNGIFHGKGEDYEKKLQHLSREEAAVHARVKRRAQRWRGSARNIILLSALLEVIAIAYAVVTTHSVDLTWQMRARRVLPMFVLPFLSTIIYYMFAGFTRMFDNRDQKILENLRAERQAKLDELKEITNYYNTQQLIQRYDLDPAAKAAAAAVLACKLGTDTGPKVYVSGDSSPSVGKSNDVRLAQTDGLRNRKHPHIMSHIDGSSAIQQVVNEGSPELVPDDLEKLAQSQKAVEHKGPGISAGGWIARIAAMLVGEDPTQCYAVICGNCHMHNGLTRREDLPHINYFCPHCHALNGPRQYEEASFGSRPRQFEDGEPSSASNSGKMSPTPVRDVSDSSLATMSETTIHLASLQEPVASGEGERSASSEGEESANIQEPSASGEGEELENGKGAESSLQAT